MFTAEMIVGLWFLPVILFVIAPLSLLCLWFVHRVLRKITDRVGQTYGSVVKAQSQSPSPRIRPRHAV